MRHSRKSVRGVLLIEALVALLVVAFGMVTLMGLQNSLRLSADLARQRGEALRLAQRDMETLRAYSVLEKAQSTADAQDFASIASTERTIHADSEGANAEYALTRQVSSSDDPKLKSIHTTVSWTDRSGTGQRVTLDSLIFGADPSLGAALSIAPGSAPSPSRDASIPARAKDLGNGSSAYKPVEDGSVAWLFNNVDAVITSVCTVPTDISTAALTSADLRDCREKSPSDSIPGIGS